MKVLDWGESKTKGLVGHRRVIYTEVENRGKAATHSVLLNAKNKLTLGEC